MRLFLLLVLLSSCATEDVIPDRFDLSFGGVESHHLGIEWYPERLVNDEDVNYLVMGTLGWDFGALRPSPDEDFERQEAMLTRLFANLGDRLADAAHHRQQPVVVVPSSSDPQGPPAPPPSKQGPEEEGEADDEHIFDLIRWYGELHLLGQIVIGVLLLGVLVTLILCRKQVVTVVKMLVPSRKS